MTVHIHNVERWNILKNHPLSSVCLWRYAFWLSGLVYMAKSCTSVFLAGMFLLSVQTLLLSDVSFSHKTHRKKRVEKNTSLSNKTNTATHVIYSIHKINLQNYQQNVAYLLNYGHKTNAQYILTWNKWICILWIMLGHVTPPVVNLPTKSAICSTSSDTKEGI